MYIANAPTVTPSAGSFLNGTGAPPPKQQLDQEDFLKLLTAQLTAQDPLKPMTDTQFIAQMANFSSLEQMRTLSADFEKLAGAHQLTSAQNLLGRTVTLNTDTAEVTGPVDEVTIKDGLLRVIIGGKPYEPTAITRILGTATPAPAK
ncbi:MAG: flagellar hook capping FlgD N-terminal domain-containing protein [Chthoniobacteraceae bacterium]